MWISVHLHRVPNNMWGHITAIKISFESRINWWKNLRKNNVQRKCIECSLGRIYILALRHITGVHLIIKKSIKLKYVPNLMVVFLSLIFKLTLSSSLYVVSSAEEQRRFRESKRRLSLPGGGTSSVLPDTSGALHSAGWLLHPTASPHRGCHQPR